MNHLIKLFSLLFLLNIGYLTAQVNPGSNCEEAGCATNGSYPSLTNVPSMGTYDCLGTTPNPNWIAVGVASDGNLVLTISQSSGDVDFAAYGPYASIDEGCPIGPETPAVDCSYSIDATETVEINNVQAGEVYIILITNYVNASGTISVTPSPTSTAEINCNVNFDVDFDISPDICNTGVGTVTANPTSGNPPYTFDWDLPGNPTTQTVTNVPAGTYEVTINSSPGSDGSTFDPIVATFTVPNEDASFSATSTPASCSGGTDGTATASYTSPGDGTETATYSWNDPLNQTTETAVNLSEGTYECTITLSNGCQGIATTTVGANNVNYNATSTIISCPGGNDGTAFAEMIPVVGNLSFQWDDGLNQTTQTATGLIAGNYNCTITSDIGCTGVVSVDVTEIPAMEPTITAQTDVTCYTGSDGTMLVSVTNGTAPYSYSWDNSTSDSNFADDLSVGNHTVTITDDLGCITSITGTLQEPNPLDITYLTPDTQICPENDILLSVVGTGGSTTKTYTWFENGNMIGVGEQMLVDPKNTGTEYCVVLSEECNSPTDEECTIITFPTPIIPSAVPDEFSKCVPDTFEFTNTSSNPSEIESTFWEFGDNITHTILEENTDSTSHYYYTTGLQTITMTVTSIYGCIYTDTLYDLIEVIPSPIADFGFSSNPTTIFETNITMQDQSTHDVIDWNWYSPYSVPTTSTSANPVFTFPDGVVNKYPITLIVETERGCIDTTTLILNVVDDILFFAPNSFTPEGDEFNQTWKVQILGIDIYNFELTIYNRWGEQIWVTKDPNAEWDGTLNGRHVPNDTYIWKAIVKSPHNDNKETFTGHINLIR